MVHNSLESFHSENGVLSVELCPRLTDKLTVEYLGLPVNCTDFKCCALIEVSLSSNYLLLFKASAISVEPETTFSTRFTCWLVLPGFQFPPSQASCSVRRSGSHSRGNQDKNGRYWRISFPITCAIVWEGISSLCRHKVNFVAQLWVRKT